MEYGLRIRNLESAYKSPGDFCDANLLELCPEASLTALYFGSEFCQELLPTLKDAEAFCEHCDQRGLQAVLLTPLVTYKGLNRVSRLLDGLVSRGRAVAVVFNDWGVFEHIRSRQAGIPLRMGRLMNRGLRDPRLNTTVMQSAHAASQRADGIRKMVSRLGVAAIESDADLESGYLGNGEDGLERTLHLPYTFVASGRNCLEKAAATPDGKHVFTHALNVGCAAPCRGVCRQEYREDTAQPLLRAGNTLFFKTPLEWVSKQISFADRLVFHEQPMP